MANEVDGNPLPRGICPLCGRDVALRRGGQLRHHRRFVRAITGSSEVCVGSGHTPEGAVSAAASQARQVADLASRAL